MVCLAGAVAILLVIWGIRVTHKDPTSSGPSLPPPSTATTASTSGASHASTALYPDGQRKLAQYEGIPRRRGPMGWPQDLVDAGSNPSTTQLAPVVTAYGSALNLYDFQLHFINWPASMESAIELDHAQLKALMSFLQSFSIVTPTGMSTWLVDLHNRAGTAQAADNVIRRKLGLSSSSSFPSIPPAALHSAEAARDNHREPAYASSPAVADRRAPGTTLLLAALKIRRTTAPMIAKSSSICAVTTRFAPRRSAA